MQVAVAGRYLSILASIFLTGLACGLATLAWLLVATMAGLPPLAVVSTMFVGAFGSAFAWEQTLRAATPLLLTGLCVAIPARAGLLIIGGEGALVMGAIAAAVVGVSVPLAVAPVALFLVAGVAGALWLGISAWLRIAHSVHEAVSGLLLSYIAIAIFNYLVEGSLRDLDNWGKPATAVIPDLAQVTNLGTTTLHWGLLVGVFACGLAYLLVSHSSLGFSFRVEGGNPRAAAFSNLPRNHHIILVCLIGGALAGLAGAFEVAAVHHRASGSLILGYGYIGILVATFARGNMLMIIFAAILIGALDAGGGLLQRRLGAPAASAALMHGLLFIALVICTSFERRLVGWWLQRRKKAYA